jgi:hypothetical protein
VEGAKLANGELTTVREMQQDGRILLADGRTLAAGFRQFVRGYAVTSYASQGKSVDHVLFSDSAVKAATNCPRPRVRARLLPAIIWLARAVNVVRPFCPCDSTLTALAAPKTGF